jgi:hypothetical protein
VGDDPLCIGCNNRSVLLFNLTLAVKPFLFIMKPKGLPGIGSPSLLLTRFIEHI